MNGKQRIVLAVSLLCVFYGLRVRAEEDDTLGRADFVSKVGPAFDILHSASRSYAEARSGLLAKEESATAEKDFERAEGDFKRAVNANWPYREETSEGGTHGATRGSEASRAFDEARKFVEQEYSGGHPDREASVARYSKVASVFPGTVEHDRALLAAAYLYLSAESDENKEDLNAAKTYFERAAKRDGSPTSYSLFAWENLASLASEPTARMEARSQFYGDLARMSNPDWLKEQLLYPGQAESPTQFCKRVTGLFVTIRACQISNAKNMVADAVRSENALASLRWLLEQHRGDAFVESEVRSAIMHAIGTTRVDVEREIESALNREYSQATGDMSATGDMHESTETRENQTATESGSGTGSAMYLYLAVGTVLVLAAIMTVAWTRRGKPHDKDDTD